jgi:uncharacterized metal-binding protein YceD (DUF177 family)
MSSPSTQIIRPEKLTLRAATWQGSVSAAALPRLVETLVAPHGEVRWRITAVATGGGHARIDCIIEGFLWRAHADSAEPQELALRRVLRLVPSEAQLPAIEDEPDDEDFIVAPEYIDVLELVEEEIILSLPSDTGMGAADNGMGDNELDDESDRERDSPFAALSTLKSRPS